MNDLRLKSLMNFNILSAVGLLALGLAGSSCKKPSIAIPEAPVPQGASASLDSEGGSNNDNDSDTTENGDSIDIEEEDPEGGDQLPINQPQLPPQQSVADNSDESASAPVPTPAPPSATPVVTKPAEPVVDKLPSPTTPKSDPVVIPAEPAKPVVKRYMIMGDASRRCITAPDAIGMQFKIYDCTNAPNQLFTLEQVAPNIMKIVTHKNHVMQIQGGQAYDLALVDTGVYKGLSTQQFRLEPKNFEGFYALNVRDTTAALDAAYKSNDNGTGLIIYWTTNPASNQRWIVKQVD